MAVHKISTLFEVSDRMSQQLATMELAAAKLDRQLVKMGDSTEEALARAEEAVEEAARSLEELEAAAGNAAPSVEKVGEKSKKSAEEADQLGNSLSETAKKLEAAVASGALLKFGGQIAGGLWDAVEANAAFESAITGVYKTVDGSATQLENVRKDVLGLSTTLPSSAADIAAVAESAGQLGIATRDVMDFTKVIVDLSEATNLGREDGASTLAKFANITGMDAEDYDNLGSSIVALGNNFATTEADIAATSMRMASAFSMAGVAEPKILATAAALSSMGIEADAGGSAMSRLIVEMQTAAETGNEQLGNFADAAGMAAGEFKQFFAEDAVAAMQAFLVGLSNSNQSATVILDNMGLTDVRLSNAIRALAGNSDLLSNAVNMSTEAWEDNTALAREADLRYGTLESKLGMMRNAASNLKIAFGDGLNPAIKEFADFGTDALVGLTGFVEENPEVVAAITGTGVALGVAAVGLAGFTLATRVAIPMIKDFTAALAANPLMLVATALVTLTAGVVAFAKVMDAQDPYEDWTANTQKQYDALQDLNAEYERSVELHGPASDEARRLANAIDTETAAFEANKQTHDDYMARLDDERTAREKVISAHEERQREIVAETQNVEGLTERLIELAGASGLSAAEMAELQAVIAGINSALPDTDPITYAGVTGADSSSVIDTLKAAAKLEAEKKKRQEDFSTLTDLFGAQIGISDSVEEQRSALEAARERMALAAKEWGDAELARGNPAQGGDSMGRGLAALIDPKRDAYKTAEEQVKDLEDELQSLEGELAANEAEINRLGTAIGETARDMGELSDAQTGVAHGVNIVRSALEATAKAYDLTYAAAAESINGQFGMFEKVEEKSTVYASTLKANMKDQEDFYTSYADKMQKAADLGVNKSVLAQLADGSVESKARLDGIVAAGAKGVAGINAQFEELAAAREKAAQAIADGVSGFSDALTEQQKAAKKAITGMDESAAAEDAARRTMDAYVRAIKDGMSSAASAAGLVADATAKALNGDFTAGLNPELPTEKPIPVPGHARGTDSAAQGWALVGEEEPELVYFGGGERVLSGKKTREVLDSPKDFSQKRALKSQTQPTAQMPQENTQVQRKEISITVNGTVVTNQAQLVQTLVAALQDDLLLSGTGSYDF
ncbi:MAG: phage tail tape measure protein [Oscillospiraceae bacterium]|jgi:TP901 family phage tail tape measure protein|nr:phage tail tape measure protein [Oscillospiraceae bacterium]